MDFLIKKLYYHFGFFWNNLTKKPVFTKKLFWVLVIGFLNLVSVDAKERSFMTIFTTSTTIWKKNSKKKNNTWKFWNWDFSIIFGSNGFRGWIHICFHWSIHWIYWNPYAVCILFTHFLMSKNVFSRGFFLEILALCMVSIQERFQIKSGLWWRAYGS